MRLRGPVPKSMLQGRLAGKYFSETALSETGKEVLKDGPFFNPEAGGPMRLESFKATPMYQELAAFADFGTAKGPSSQDLAKAQLSRLIGGSTVLGGALKQATKKATNTPT